MAQRIGVISIRPKLEGSLSRPFDDVYNSFGMNTGNYMFTTAMYRQLAGNPQQIDFEFEPSVVNEQFDAVVIPAANWLNVDAEWDWFSDKIEKLEIPVVTIGLGIQAASSNTSAIEVNGPSVRLAKLLSKKSNFLSVRGNFTARFLNSIGVFNVVVTGCPSLYMALENSGNESHGEGVVIQSTRYGITLKFVEQPSINRQLFSMAANNNFDMIYQSEPEEIEYILRRRGARQIFTRRPDLFRQLYGLSSEDALLKYIDEHGYVFFDIEDWSSFLRSREMLLGTRLHGAILALNSNVPAILFGHDSRTAEMIEFAQLPTVEPDLAQLRAGDLHALVDDTALSAYYDARKFNGRIYREFLTANGLVYNDDAIL